MRLAIRLSLMKGDEGAEVYEEAPDAGLFPLVRNRDLNLHHLAFGDIETRNPLSEHLDLIAKRIGPQHVGKIARVEAAILAVPETEAVQIEIVEVGGPNTGHSNFFRRFRGNREEGIAPAHDILARVDLDPLKSCRVTDGIVKDVGIGDKPGCTVAKVFLRLTSQAAISGAHVPQLTLFPSGYPD